MSNGGKPWNKLNDAKVEFKTSSIRKTLYYIKTNITCKYLYALNSIAINYVIK